MGPLKRFLIERATDGAFVASVYADSFEDLGDAGQGCGHFRIGNRIVASIYAAQYRVIDSTGRLIETPEQAEQYISEEIARAGRPGCGWCSRLQHGLAKAVDLLSHIRGSEIPGPEPKRKLLKDLRSLLLSDGRHVHG